MSLLCAALKIVKSFNDFMLDAIPSRNPQPATKTQTHNQKTKNRKQKQATKLSYNLEHKNFAKKA